MLAPLFEADRANEVKLYSAEFGAWGYIRGKAPYTSFLCLLSFLAKESRWGKKIKIRLKKELYNGGETPGTKTRSLLAEAGVFGWFVAASPNHHINEKYNQDDYD